MTIVSAIGDLPFPPQTSSRLIEIPYFPPNAGVPLLNSFFFSFADENNVNTIMVLPGGDSEDLTPAANIEPEVVRDGHLRLMFSDRALDDAKDFYGYRMRHAVYPSSAARFQVRGDKCVARCRRNILELIPRNHPLGGLMTQPSILALCGFKLFFPQGVDHRLDEVEVTLHDDGDLVVALNDRNNDDAFGYIVDFARIPLVGINVIAGESSGFDEFHHHARIPPLSHAELVLRGFRIRYRQPLDYQRTGDRRLLRVGVVQVDDEIQIHFRDGDGLEQFEWTIRWAMIGPQVLAYGTDEPI